MGVLLEEDEPLAAGGVRRVEADDGQPCPEALVQLHLVQERGPGKK